MCIPMKFPSFINSLRQNEKYEPPRRGMYELLPHKNLHLYSSLAVLHHRNVPNYFWLHDCTICSLNCIEIWFCPILGEIIALVMEWLVAPKSETGKLVSLISVQLFENSWATNPIYSSSTPSIFISINLVVSLSLISVLVSALYVSSLDFHTLGRLYEFLFSYQNSWWRCNIFPQLWHSPLNLPIPLPPWWFPAAFTLEQN